MDILFLQPAERSLLAARRLSFAEDFTIAEETHTFRDDPRRMMIRLSLVRLRSPALIALREKIEQASTLEQAAAIIAEHDLRGVPDEDLSQIVFALGSEVLGQVIWMLIRAADSTDDLMRIAALSFLRHEIFLSYVAV